MESFFRNITLIDLSSTKEKRGELERGKRFQDPPVRNVSRSELKSSCLLGWAGLGWAGLKYYVRLNLFRSETILLKVHSRKDHLVVQHASHSTRHGSRVYGY